MTGRDIRKRFSLAAYAVRLRRGIEAKVFRLALRITLIAVLATAIISVSGLFLLRASMSRISTNLTGQMSEGSRKSLEKQALDELSQEARAKASLLDEHIYLIDYFAYMLVDESERILRYPEVYPQFPVEPPESSNDGRLVMQLLHDDRTSIEEARRDSARFGNLGSIMLAIAQNGPDVLSAYVSLESGSTIIADSDSGLHASGSLNAKQRPWYRAAVEAEDLAWSEIYEDTAGRGFVITCSVPFYAKDGSLDGVGAIDLKLSRFSDISGIAELTENTSIFLLNSQGVLIDEDSEVGSSDTPLDGEAGNAEKPGNLAESSDSKLRELAEAMMDDKQGVRQVALDGEDVYVAFAPLENLDWNLAVVQSVEKVMEPIRLGERSIEAMQTQAHHAITQAISVMVAALVVAAFTIIVLVALLSRRFAHALTAPITLLRQRVSEIASGNLDTVIAIDTSDEIEDLGASVSSMSRELKEHIRNLNKVTAERERIGAELSIATRIQNAMLPQASSPFPERHEFRLVASMQAAKEVGGDFYDFFLIDDDTLVVIMADVSGKGVPAALFMAISKTVIKHNAMGGMGPGEALSSANKLLCESNSASMFVTVFIGYLTISTGRFRYANAGHTPPLIRRSDAGFELLPMLPGMVLAGLEGIRYRELVTSLSRGDEILLYTDGVTEMANERHELFGEERLIHAVSNVPQSQFERLLPELKSQVFAFAGSAEQTDDLTVLALQFVACDASCAEDARRLGERKQTDMTSVIPSVMTSSMTSSTTPPVHGESDGDLNSMRQARRISTHTNQGEMHE
ncbi:MAG: SpoIIE family protein phosphatase [Bifidobacterium sp.]|uniref:SpoIIE family protein phosphatase n=1 Tax=Bifidobacterium sp. TaxID=41200 RepID=UPI0039E92571